MMKNHVETVHSMNLQIHYADGKTLVVVLSFGNEVLMERLQLLDKVQHSIIQRTVHEETICISLMVPVLLLLHLVD